MLRGRLLHVRESETNTNDTCSRQFLFFFPLLLLLGSLLNSTATPAPSLSFSKEAGWAGAAHKNNYWKWVFSSIYSKPKAEMQSRIHNGSTTLALNGNVLLMLRAGVRREDDENPDVSAAIEEHTRPLAAELQSSKRCRHRWRGAAAIRRWGQSCAPAAHAPESADRRM
jgi:hypothetical protein